VKLGHTLDGKRLKIVVAGAHPDDPESCCGGTTLLYADEGDDVVYLYLTRGEAGIDGVDYEEAARIRTAEVEASCKILGARPVFLGQVDGATEISAEWYERVRGVLAAEGPDIVITHWPIDTHRDHRAMGLLVYDAWLHLGRTFELYYFEAMTGQQTQVFNPTAYVDISGVEERKRAACLAHASQHPAEGFYAVHQAMHRQRGNEAGVPLAEAFVRHESRH